MFRPERMRLIEIITLRSMFPLVSETLWSFGAVHVEKAASFFGAGGEAKEVSTSDQLAVYDRLIARVEETARLLRMEYLSSAERPATVTPEQVAGAVEREFAAAERKVKSNLNEIERRQQELGRLEALSWQLQMLEDLGADIGVIREPRYMYLRLGSVPSANLDTLRATLQRVPHELHLNRRLKDDALVLVAAGPETKDRVQRALRAARFTDTAIPSHYSDDAREAAGQGELDVWENREAIAEARAELDELREQHEGDLRCWWRDLTVNRKVLESMSNFLRTRSGYYIVGWVPESRAEELVQDLQAKCEDKIEVDLADPEEALHSAVEPIQVPTKFRHPPWLRPFQRLITVYGYPAYENLDPTLFAAITFVVMFGLMFGDVGHGAVLGLFGGALVCWKVAPRAVRDFGYILLLCGLSGLVCGFLFGSFFGNEELLPARWFRPVHNHGYFLMVGIVLGAIVINLGLIISVVQSLLQRDYHSALFGQWGALSTVFYWIVLGLSVIAYKTGKIDAPWWQVALVLAIPLLILALGDIFIPRKHHGDEESDLAEAIFKPMEISLGLLTNTVSFVRVAAFGLNHAALLAATMEVADLMSGGRKGLWWGNVLTGNLVVILLEGLVVFIQCMRLEYYEFFSKFFSRQGIKFEPLAAEHSA